MGGVMTAIATSGSRGNSVLLTTPGTGSWTVPTGVTSISVVCVGGGAAGGQGLFDGINTYSGGAGGGGGLAYISNMTVTPGQVITYRVGAGGFPFLVYGDISLNGDNTYFGPVATPYAQAFGGVNSAITASGNGGTFSIATGLLGGGGAGGDGSIDFTVNGYGGGGGGAGGYGLPAISGGVGIPGGRGGDVNNGQPGTSNGATPGGGGGGGAAYTWNGAGGSGGGGVGLFGRGANGAGGSVGSIIANAPGQPGSFADRTYLNADYVARGFGSDGGFPGGGGGGGSGNDPTTGLGARGGAGGGGAIRIVWPGSTRQFPNTLVGTW